MNNTCTTLATCASLFLIAPAFAQEPANEAYLGDSSRGVVKSGAGDCVRTSAWTPDRMIEGCGKVVAKPVPVVVAPPPPPPPAPAPVVVAPPPPPPPVAVVAPPPPKPVVRKVSLEADALFAFNKAQFSRDSQTAELDKFGQQVRSLKSIESVKVVGHTDNLGSSAYNQSLSQRRADVITKLMVDRGINPGLISTTAMGERSPVADNKTREGRAKNRRVEIVITGTE